MNLKRIIPVVVFFVLLFAFLLFVSSGQDVALFNPKGIIALKERNLMILAVLLMMVLAVPVYILTFIIAVKYREGNKKAKYAPELKPGKLFEAMWWVVPTIIILILAVINWKSTHELDPFRPLQSDKKPILIQVVALRWKWLFIYPEQNIAAVNFVQFPAKTPINFELTSDAPMSSFWIPSLSGQIYSMTGMGTKIHMMADSSGDFHGSAAEINGKGFSGMRFVARASSNEDFDMWVKKVREESRFLSLSEYKNLARPSENNPVVFYSSTEKDLYNKIIDKFSPSQQEDINNQEMEIK